MAYTAALEQQLIDHFIYPPCYHLTQNPANLGDIQTRLNRRRPSLDQSCFSDDDYSEILKKDGEDKSKSSSQSLVFSTFIGKLDIPHVQGISLKNLAHLTDGSIHKPRLEFYDGVHPSKLGWELREDFAKFIEPSNNPSVPILPTFLMTVAAPPTGLKYLTRAAWYYGVFAARAIYQLRAHIPSQVLNDKRAYVVTAGYDPDSTLLRLYTTHMVLTDNPATPFQYHTVVCGSWCLESGAETFRTAISALRNAREWARDQRDDLIRLANGMADEILCDTN